MAHILLIGSSSSRLPLRMRISSISSGKVSSLAFFRSTGFLSFWAALMQMLMIVLLKDLIISIQIVKMIEVGVMVLVLMMMCVQLQILITSLIRIKIIYARCIVDTLLVISYVSLWLRSSILFVNLSLVKVLLTVRLLV